MPVALITGASSGIGAAIAQALAPTHRLIFVGRPSNQLNDLARRYKAQLWLLDFTDPASIKNHIHHLEDLDVLVHSAGVLIPGDFAHGCFRDWQHVFNVNLFSVVELTTLLLPALRKAHGQVIFINSTAGLVVSPHMAAYSASKFALRAVADVLRVNEPQLRITTVYPGRTDTPMQRQLVASENRDYHPEDFLRPDTVAATVVHVINTSPDGYLPEVTIRPY